jgi:hypothetical protein
MRKMMSRILAPLVLVGTALALGGCVVVPERHGSYYSPPPRVFYGNPAYAPAPRFYAPPPHAGWGRPRW